MPALAAATLAALGAGCIENGYPLSASGQVDIRTDVSGKLFAADRLDASGRADPATRQKPYSTGLNLFLTEANEPAFGAFVEVRVVPAEALSITSDPAEGEHPTCELTEGAMRCTGSEQGYARLIATSEADWSGIATVIVSWADRTEEQEIEILPAGLPDDVSDFAIIIGEADSTDRVPAALDALECKTLAAPEPGPKWREGKVRMAEAFVRAAAPLSAPGVVENAPVHVDSLEAETQLSLDPTCAEAARSTKLRLVLDEVGESERFYLCFSDLGGRAEVSVYSGQEIISPNRTIDVDPEPRVLSVKTITQTPIELGSEVRFEIAAFDVLKRQMPMAVDLEVDDKSVLGLDVASLTLADDEEPATILEAATLSAGSARLTVTPRLLATPACQSEEITVGLPPPL